MTRRRDWEPVAWFDPVPGDPDEIAALARRYAETAQAIASAVDSLKQIADSSTCWESGAGTAFRDSTRDVAGTIDKARARYVQTSEALAGYGQELSTLQSSAERAYQDGMEGYEDERAAQRATAVAAGAEEPDETAVQGHERAAEAASGRLADAQGRLRDLRDQWDDLGNRTASRIEDISEGDDLNDSGWDNFLDFVEGLTDVMGKLSAIFGVIALICAVIPFLQPFAAFFGALAFLTGLMSLAGNVLLYANGRSDLSDVLWDLVGVVSFGAGRAFTIAGRAVATGARGLAKPAFISAARAGGLSSRQARRLARARGITGGGREAGATAKRAASPAGWLPRPGEIARGFDPRRAFQDVVGGRAPSIPRDARSLPPVAAALRRSRRAQVTANAAGVLGNVGDANSLLGDHIPAAVPLIGQDAPGPLERTP